MLKDIRRAISRGGLTESGSAVAETFHLLEEALRSELQIEAVIAAEEAPRNKRLEIISSCPLHNTADPAGIRHNAAYAPHRALDRGESSDAQTESTVPVE